MYFNILVHRLKKKQMFGAPSSIPEGDRDMNSVSPLWKFNFVQLLFEALFDIIRTFGRNQWVNQNSHHVLIKNPPVIVTTSHTTEM